MAAMSHKHRMTLLALVALSLVAADAIDVAYTAPEKLGEVENELVRESSGLAISRRDASMLWTHNDSGDGPVLYAMDRQGKHVGAVMLDGVWARDWEDMASATFNDTPTLIVGDIGDNPRKRRRVTVYFIEEPTADDAQPIIHDGHEMFPKVEPLTLHLEYPDGSHDGEALTVDPTTNHLYLISKEHGGNRETTMYRTAIPDDLTGQTRELEAVGRLPYRPVQAADMSADGRRLIVLIPGAAYLYDRGADESWAEAIKRPALRVRIPGLRQGEAIAFGQDGLTLYLTSEQRPTPLYRIAPGDEE